METLTKSTMTQQEIFQNMTKGEWLSYSEDFITAKEGNVVCQFFDREEEDFENKNANRLAIACAVNNTYGKGINPESVEKMKEIVEAVLNLPNGGSHPQKLYDELNELSIKAEEALTAAKL